MSSPANSQDHGHPMVGDRTVPAGKASGFWVEACEPKNYGFPLTMAVVGTIVTFLFTQQFFALLYVLFPCAAGFFYNILRARRTPRTGFDTKVQAGGHAS